jgi:hypothetical protein
MISWGVKAQRKRPRHEPDSESDGDDSEAELENGAGSESEAEIRPLSPKRKRMTSPTREDSLEPFPPFASLPDPYATEYEARGVTHDRNGGSGEKVVADPELVSTYSFDSHQIQDRRISFAILQPRDFSLYM